MRKPLICVALLVLAVAAAPAPRADVTAVVGGRVLVGDGTVLEQATVIFEDGLIVEVGEDVRVPAGAKVIDAKGRWVCPGMIDPYTSVGMVLVGSDIATNDSNEATMNATPHVRAVDAIDPDSPLIPVGRLGGVTTVLVTAGSRNPINGQAAVVDLYGRTVDEMLVAEGAGLVFAFSRGGGRFGESSSSGYPSTRIGVMAFLRQTLYDARRYMEQQEEAAEKAEGGKDREPSEQGGGGGRNLIHEALIPVLKGQVSVFAEAHNVQEIRNALKLAEEFKLKLIFVNPSGAHHMLDEIKASGFPVLLGNVFSTPSDDEPFDLYYSLAARLHKAGIVFAFTTGSAHGIRTLPTLAAMSVAYGLPETDAFKALTLNPAEILGVGGEYGSLEKGKVANVAVWDGDPLQNRSKVVGLFIRGREVALESRQEQLRDKFMDLEDK